MAQQFDWRWCRVCQVLAFGGGQAGVCLGNSAHDHSGSGNYVLVQNDPSAPGQSGWRWCRRCQDLAFAGGAAAGACAAGGRHDHTGSGAYVVHHNDPAAPGQPGWRWCRRCQGLAFTGGTPGVCAAGGTHDHTGSGRYTVELHAEDALDDGRIARTVLLALSGDCAGSELQIGALMEVPR